MPTLTREEIRKIACSVLHAAGASESNAEIVASHLADANMAGQDSHGLIRVPQYVVNIREGRTNPAADPEVVQDAGALARVDGHHTFGQVVGLFATNLAVEKARESGIAMVSMGKLGHTGRIGTYPEVIAKAGMAGIFCTGATGPGATIVPPFRGADGKLSTNPIAFGFPYAPDSPILLDYATSASAEGKVRVYRNRGHQLPDKWILDSDGEPTTEPQAFYDGGMILPFGGLTGGHKGYALSVLVTLLGGALGSTGQTPEIEGAMQGGSMVIAIDVGRLVPLDDLTEVVGAQVDHVKSSSPIDPSQPVDFPGEYEVTHRRQRLEEGVEIEPDTWDVVADSIREFGLEEQLGLSV